MVFINAEGVFVDIADKQRKVWATCPVAGNTTGDDSLSLKCVAAGIAHPQ
jgi:hypothetical protein